MMTNLGNRISPTLPFLILMVSCGSGRNRVDFSEDSFLKAERHAREANEGFRRSVRFVGGWLEQADPVSGLIPRNLREGRDIWNAQDSAADNYPFMVLTSAILDRELFQGRMLEMLRSERARTSRLGSLPDTFSFSRQGFLDARPDMGGILFGSSEYVKDGLLPLTEWLGPSPWSERMLEILDDMWEMAPVESPFGNVVSTSAEVNGEMLQTLSRVYWMTGDKKYLEWALRLGDFYLLGEHHPTRDSTSLRLRDHGCEVISGLTELYATVHSCDPRKMEAYRDPLYAMLDRVLEVGRNEHGLFFNRINPVSAEVLDESIADTWGYTLNAYYTVYLLDGKPEYRQAVLKALSSLDAHYRSFDWEHGSADGYADAIESGLNLYQREPLESVSRWLDSEIRVLWEKQQPSGIIEGWHGDGNFARTTLMYCLWKTAGLTVRPWREDVLFGAVMDRDLLHVSLKADDGWEGAILFDRPRHRLHLNLPLDWPRINQFPEWFTVEPGSSYELVEVNSERRQAVGGNSLAETGYTVRLEPGIELRLLVRRTG